MKLIKIDSSITGDNSVSRSLTTAIVAKLVGAVPSLTVTIRDLAADPLSHVDLAALTDDGSATASASVLDEFLDADIVVIGAPMYNFAPPSQLKAWIDRILIAGRTFRYGADGPEGLAGKQAGYCRRLQGWLLRCRQPYGRVRAC